MVAMSDFSVLSFDFGTSGVKAALVSSEGMIIACESEGYDLIVPKTGYAEQSPGQYWSAMVKCVRRILSRPAGLELKGVSLCTQWKGMIPLDKDGDILHNNIIWMDARAGEQASQMNKATGTSFFTAQSYWARLKWCRDNLERAYGEAESILEVNSFIKWKLTGEKAVDISNDFIHSPDPKLDAFYRENVKLAGLKRSQFPKLTMSSDMAGRVSAAASEETGIPEGTPVFSGCGDIPAIAIGSGCAQTGMAHAYFGTSGWVGTVVPHSFGNVYVPSSAFTENQDIVLQTMQSVGNAFNWTVRQLYHEEWNKLGSGVFRFVDADASGIPAGSCGVMATPWIAGELPPLSEMARTVFVGVSLNHDRRHMINAMMEGICYSMKGRFMGDHGVSCLSVVGGGANSDHWMQILADVIQVPVSVPENNQHAGAMGAAICALVGLGYYKSLNEAAGFVREKKRFSPDPARKGLYNELYNVYCGLYKALEPSFEQLLRFSC